MNKTIWKWSINGGKTTISIPIGAEILTVQKQREEVVLWALVDADSKKEEKEIMIYGTGHKVKDNPGKYINTFQVSNGNLVFHVFDESIAQAEEM